MKQSRLITASILTVATAMAMASDSTLKTPLSAKSIDPASKYAATTPQTAVVAGAAVAIFGKPTLGVRVGLGDWNNLAVDAGIDVTFNIPVIPLPGIRVDYEAWSTADNWGDRHGNDFSILGMQNFAMFYAGVGPSYYFTDDQGDHRSGFGAKLLVGTRLPGNVFVEAGGILGEAPTPIFISLGKRF